MRNSGKFTTEARRTTDVPERDQIMMVKNVCGNGSTGLPQIETQGMRSTPNLRRITTVNQKRRMVMMQLMASAGQNDQPERSIQGRMRNMGRVGRTNQKVPSAWPAILSPDWPARCIHIIARSEVSGRAMSRAERRSLYSWTLVTMRMMTAVRMTLKMSKAEKAKTLSHGIDFMAR